MSDSSSRTSDSPTNIFQLLVPANSSDLELQGRCWKLTGLTPIPEAKETPEYTCISYVWGEKTVVNPLDKQGEPISSRTIPVLDATIRSCQPAAIWIDAMCVPFAPSPARNPCLCSMGAIYSKASQVVVVLPETYSNLLEQIHKGHVDEKALLDLEKDEWVTRVWTYQELVNSRSVCFIVEKGSDVSVSGDQFLNFVGQAINEYKKAKGYDSFKLRYCHPRLDSLESLILGWMTANYLEKSAYQVMSDMELREAKFPKDRFYAMIGTITTTPADSQSAQSVNPAEYFMQVCEAKGDYSFIYSTAPRSEIPGRCWRPIPDPREPLHPILSWSSYGERQSGCTYPTHLQLNNMCRLTIGSISPSARQFIKEWLQSDNTVSLSDTIQISIFCRLKDAGFSGCEKPLELKSGYFFPRSTITDLEKVFVVVATEVRWVHGAPGLLVRDDGTDIYHYCGVGVFVGPVPQTGDSINIGKME